MVKVRKVVTCKGVTLVAEILKNVSDTDSRQLIRLAETADYIRNNSEKPLQR